MTGGRVYVVTDSGDIWAPIARDLPARRVPIMVPMTRNFLVTGGNTGIGLATAIALARDGGRVHIACRNPERGQAAVAAIKSAAGGASVELLPLDLTSLASVQDCAREFLARDEPLHVLINNAGIAGARGLTADGFEPHFGVNHLGHFALTMLLLDRLKASGPGSRIVNVSSASHYGAKGIDWAALRRRTKTITGLREYEVSKLCNVLFTQELARRLGGGPGADAAVTTYAAHPGRVASDIWRHVPWPARPVAKRFMLTTEQGAVTPLHCAASPDVGPTGLYYEDCQAVAPNPVAAPELAGLLWRRSAEWTGVG
jgi:retinol dehydrogenase 12